MLQLNAAVDKPHIHSRNILDGKFAVAVLGKLLRPSANVVCSLLPSYGRNCISDNGCNIYF